MKITNIVLMTAGLVITTFGGVGGCGDSGVVDTTINPAVSVLAEEFTGTFTMIDHKCSYEPIQSLTISAPSGPANDQFSLTILDAGGTGHTNGDSFPGGFKDGKAYFNTLACSATKIASDADAQTVENQHHITAATGDLLFLCTDLKAIDSFCWITYSP